MLAPRSVRVAFWEAVRRGASVAEASGVSGVRKETGRCWFAQAGGVVGNAPGPVSGRYLSFEEREEIALARAAGLGVRAIAARLGRSPGSISREIGRNKGWRGRYTATHAQVQADARARRPKPVKLATNPVLRTLVEALLLRRWSPEQIAAKLNQWFPDQDEMQVSHETIYQCLYVQARGGLRRELALYLRTGRRLRKPRRKDGQAPTLKGIPDMVHISLRPAEAEDRAVPGHWEGDLIIGKNTASAIGTLVERTTRFCLLLHLPAGHHDAATVAAAMTEAIKPLPTQLRRSLTWDQGRELAAHKDITIATGLDIYFCDPHSPWQRGSNENTNGLLRQYFPKSTDLTTHTPQHLAAIAAELNARPRKTLDWDTPAERLATLLSNPDTTSSVATTP
jgi:IS30 family transposase